MLEISWMFSSKLLLELLLIVMLFLVVDFHMDGRFEFSVEFLVQSAGIDGLGWVYYVHLSSCVGHVCFSNHADQYDSPSLDSSLPHQVVPHSLH